MTPPLAKETLALLDAIHPPAGAASSAHTDAHYAAIEPVHAVLEQLQDVLRAVRRAHRAAVRTETHIQGTAFFEKIRHTCDAAEAQAQAAIAQFEALGRSLDQLDRYAIEWRASNATFAERQARTEQSGQGLATVPIAELNRLRAIAAKQDAP